MNVHISLVFILSTGQVQCHESVLHKVACEWMIFPCSWVKLSAL